MLLLFPSAHSIPSPPAYPAQDAGRRQMVVFSGRSLCGFPQIRFKIPLVGQTLQKRINGSLVDVHHLGYLPPPARSRTYPSAGPIPGPPAPGRPLTAHSSVHPSFPGLFSFVILYYIYYYVMSSTIETKILFFKEAFTRSVLYDPYYFAVGHFLWGMVSWSCQIHFACCSAGRTKRDFHLEIGIGIPAFLVYIIL